MKRPFLIRGMALLLASCLAGNALIPAGAATFGKQEAALAADLQQRFQQEAVTPSSRWSLHPYDIARSAITRLSVLGYKFIRRPSLERIADIVPRFDPGTSWIALFDVNGTLLEPTWKDQYAMAYQIVMGNNTPWVTAMHWVEERQSATVGNQPVLVKMLMDTSHQNEDTVLRALKTAKHHFATLLPPRAMPYMRDSLKALRERGVRIVACSNSRLGRDIILEQLRRSGLLEFIDEKDVIGIDEMDWLLPPDIVIPPGTERRVLARAAFIRHLRSENPGHSIAYFNDSTEGFDDAAGADLNIGVLSGKGPERAVDRARFLTVKTHYLLHRWNDWRSLLKILKIESAPRWNRLTAVSVGNSIRHPIFSVFDLKSFIARLRAHTIRAMAAIGDIHGHVKRLDQILEAIDNAGMDQIVLMGDYMDRDEGGLQVMERVRPLVESGKAVGLFGNHETSFIVGMMGDDGWLANWLIYGGHAVLKEVGITLDHPLPRTFDDLRRDAAKAGLSEMDYVRYMIPSDKREEIRRHPRLRDTAHWMQKHLKLFHRDENGTFYIHAGLPLDSSGKFSLDYQGKRGLEALAQMEHDFHTAISPSHPVFQALKNKPASPTLIRQWHATLSEEALDALLDELGALRIVFGHDVADGLSDLSYRAKGKLNPIDFGMANAFGGRGGFWILDSEGITTHTFEERMTNDRTASIIITGAELLAQAEDAERRWTHMRPDLLLLPLLLKLRASPRWSRLFWPAVALCVLGEVLVFQHLAAQYGAPGFILSALLFGPLHELFWNQRASWPERGERLGWAAAYTLAYLIGGWPLAFLVHLVKDIIVLGSRPGPGQVFETTTVFVSNPLFHLMGLAGGGILGSGFGPPGWEVPFIKLSTKIRLDGQDSPHSCLTLTLTPEDKQMLLKLWQESRTAGVERHIWGEIDDSGKLQNLTREPSEMATVHVQPSHPEHADPLTFIQLSTNWELALLSRIMQIIQDARHDESWDASNTDWVLNEMAIFLILYKHYLDSHGIDVGNITIRLGDAWSLTWTQVEEAVTAMREQIHLPDFLKLNVPFPFVFSEYCKAYWQKAQYLGYAFSNTALFFELLEKLPETLLKIHALASHGINAVFSSSGYLESSFDVHTHLNDRPLTTGDVGLFWTQVKNPGHRGILVPRGDKLEFLCFAVDPDDIQQRDQIQAIVLRYENKLLTLMNEGHSSQHIRSVIDADSERWREELAPFALLTADGQLPVIATRDQITPGELKLFAPRQSKPDLKRGRSQTRLAEAG